MANSISYASVYLKKLDQAFKQSSVTQNLEAAQGTWRNSDFDPQTIYIQSLSLQGLGAYSRSTGYTSGDATLTWNSHTFSQERSRKFTIDVMDLREAYLAIAKVGTEFQRMHVSPEIDAYRFEAISTACSIDVNADLTYDNTIEAIDTGIQTLDDAEVPKEGRVLYVSNTVHKNMKQSGVFTYNRQVDTSGGTSISRDIEMYEGMRVIKVPSARFYSDFDFTASGAGKQNCPYSQKCA